MTDPEYMRAWRKRRKDIAEGKPVPEKPPAASSDRAAYMRDYRAVKKLKQDNKPVKAPLLTDEALNAAILKRGKVLKDMMDTPVCLWPAEWFEE